MKLYSFFRSGTSHRLRIALNLKGLATRLEPIDLRTEQHLNPRYKAIHPQGLVPALVLDGAPGDSAERVLIQTPAIIEWLEEHHPTPPLLPRDPEQRVHVRALAAIVGCDIHPVNNRRILETLRNEFGAAARRGFEPDRRHQALRVDRLVARLKMLLRAQVDRRELIREALEVQRDAQPVRGAAAEERIKLHRMSSSWFGERVIMPCS